MGNPILGNFWKYYCACARVISWKKKAISTAFCGQTSMKLPMKMGIFHHKKTLNDRYNASKRTIFETMDPQTVPCNLAKDPLAKHTLVLDNSLTAKMLGPQAIIAGSKLLVKVSHSLSTSVLTTPLPSSSLVYKINKATEKLVIAISPNNGSYALLLPERVLKIEVPVGEESDFLNPLQVQVHVENILSVCLRGSTLLLHQPSPEIASSIDKPASGVSVTVMFTTSSSDLAKKSRTRINSYAPKRVFQSLIPSRVSAFIDCSTSGQNRRAGSLPASCLPPSCLRTITTKLQKLQQARCFSTADWRQKFV